jgi:hypothetical protein
MVLLLRCCGPQSRWPDASRFTIAIIFRECAGALRYTIEFGASLGTLLRTLVVFVYPGTSEVNVTEMGDVKLEDG